MKNSKPSLATTILSMLQTPQVAVTYPNTGYPDAVKEKFGDNLELVFGPKNQRVDYRTLSQKDIAERLEKIPEKLWVNQTRGGMLTILDSWILALDNLADSKALWGVDLPPHAFMPMEGTERHAVENLWINYGSQRILYLRHVLALCLNLTHGRCLMQLDVRTVRAMYILTTVNIVPWLACSLV